MKTFFMKLLNAELHPNKKLEQAHSSDFQAQQYEQALILFVDGHLNFAFSARICKYVCVDLRLLWKDQSFYPRGGLLTWTRRGVTKLGISLLQADVDPRRSGNGPGAAYLTAGAPGGTVSHMIAAT